MSKNMMQDVPPEQRNLPACDNNKLSKGEMVYNYLKDGIITGVWHPGDRINDKELSEHIGVNRLSVREALSRLIQDNIVIQIPWKGYYIRNVTTEEIVAFADVRTALEQLALKDIFRKNSEQEIQQLVIQMDTVIAEAEQALAQGDHALYMKIDFNFHELVYEASGNPWIPKMIADTRIFTNILRNLSMGADDTQFENAALQSIADHRDILEAIKNQDEEKAHQLMEQHLTYRFTSNIVRNYLS